MYLKKLCKKNVKNSNLAKSAYSTNPLVDGVMPPKAFTRKAVELFEKQSDIKKFTQLILQSEITDEFLNNTQAELLLKDVFDPFEDESYSKLAQNEALLEDLTSDTDV